MVKLLEKEKRYRHHDKNINKNMRGYEIKCGHPKVSITSSVGGRTGTYGQMDNPQWKKNTVKITQRLGNILYHEHG